MAVNNGLRVWVVLKQNGEEPRQPAMVGTWLTAVQCQQGQDGTGNSLLAVTPGPGLVESTGKVVARGVEHCFSRLVPT